MTTTSLSTAVRAAARKRNGGTPEDARRKENQMNTAVQERPQTGKKILHIDPAFHIESERRKMAVWLDHLVSESKKKPISQIVSLTPVLAETLLNRNTGNRRISQAKVEEYARDIKAGTWALNGEPIIVADTGEMNDGQHRCQAVIEAQTATDVVLIVGMKRDTRTTLDQGKTRSVGDYLAMEGNAYVNVLGSAAGYVWSYRNRGNIHTGGSRVRPTKGEIMAVVEENPGIQRSVLMVQEKAADAVGGKSVLAFAHFILSAVHREDADHYIYSLMSGAGLKSGDPILYVRNRLINERGRHKAPAKAELLFKGWNAFRQRERATRFLLTGTIPTPV